MEDSDRIFSLGLTGERHDAARARVFVREVLPGLGWSARVDDVCLLVSELVANVALHARTAGRVVVDAPVEGVLKIAVSDENPAMPVLRHFSAGATTGRGLRMVAGLSASWGVDELREGKVVWFSLSERESGVVSDAALSGATTGPTGPGDVDLDELMARFGEPPDPVVTGAVARLRLFAA